MRFRDDSGEQVELVLYKFDFCPYCRVVARHMEALGLDIPTRDTLEDPGARDELIRIGGKGQVPCLVINGEALYESEDINAYLSTLQTE